MTAIRTLPENPTQLLPRSAYVDDQWLARERAELFGKTWSFAGVVSDFTKPGDYRTYQVGNYPLVVLMDRDGDLRAFHNICRHRGTELLEGSGNAGSKLVCPYHLWVYNLDGALKGVPAKSECFPDLDVKSVRLMSASIGFFKGLIFIHPSADPDESFDEWLASVPDHVWPHDLDSTDLQEFGFEVVYEMKCNWKVFFENAIDGYHLAYLHKHTLGGPVADQNVWDAHGRHLLWYSTERDGQRHPLPQFLEKNIEKYGQKKVKAAKGETFAGVYMLFPTTIITPSPYSFTISTLEPVDANTTRLRARSWQPKGMFSYREKITDIPGYDKESGLIKSSHWKVHPLETGDFQTEDVWVCEKMQRAMQSPAYQVGGLAKGAGAEAPLAFFQQLVLDYVPLES